MLGQHAAAGLPDVSGGTSARVPGLRSENSGPSGQRGRRGGCTRSRRRTRLPGDALILRDVGLGLSEQVPARHRLGSIGPGGRTADAGGGRECDGSPMWLKMCSMGAASVLNAALGLESATVHNPAIAAPRTNIASGSEAVCSHAGSGRPEPTR